MDDQPILFAEPPESSGTQRPLGTPNLAVAGTDPDLIRRSGYDVDDKGNLVLPKASEPPPAPERATEPPPAPQFGPRDMAEALVMADSFREQQRQQRARWEATMKAKAAAFEPPPLPSGEEAEQLILDEGQLLKVLRANQEWTRRALETQQQLFAEIISNVDGRIQAQGYEVRAGAAMGDAATRLYEMGVPNGDQIVSELEARMRTGSPEAYWNVITNPDNIVRGAQMLMLERGQFPAPVAAPASVGYTPGTPSSGPRPVADDPAIRWAEAMLKTKIRPEYRERYAQEMGGFR